MGKSYATVNSYRSALSSVLPPIEGFPIGKHPLIIRLMKGIFNTNPPKPRYTRTWQVSQVLDYLSSLGDDKDLDLIQLSEKLSSLASIVSAQRMQTLSFLDISHLCLTNDSASFHVMDLLKTTSIRKNISHQTVEFKVFPSNPKLCVVSTLREYLKRTEPLRQQSGESRLFISTRKPHKRVTRATIARWLKKILVSSGIDISVFSAHSYRGASASCAYNHGVSIEEIMSKASWSNAKTFKDFYFKPVVDDSKFATAVLKQ